jgi:5-formyltetrahydrofolate cyclo-ligase
MREGTKEAIRTRCVNTRSHLAPAERDRTAAELVGTVLTALADLPPGPVAAYASVGTEPGTSELLAALLRGSRTVLLPLLLDDGDLDWAAYDGALRPGPRGLLQPAGPSLGPDAVASCTLLVVPALAVDRSGTRLGRGGGSYDRALARATGLAVAALHHGELVERLPAEPHDQPVHAAAVPGEGLVRLRPHPPAAPTWQPGGMEP